MVVFSSDFIFPFPWELIDKIVIDENGEFVLNDRATEKEKEILENYKKNIHKMIEEETNFDFEE